jgi:predicted metal-dependent hydrolase
MSEDFAYAVKFQRRKTLALHVLAEGVVEVRAPLGLPESHIIKFVEERAAWVLRTREKQQKKHRWQNAVEPGAPLWFMGTPRRLEVHRASIPNSGDIFVGAETLQVFARDPHNLPALARQLEEWLRAQASAVFQQRLLVICALFADLQPPALRLRKMRQRWGSCSRRGQVTLNTELIKLPPALIDYVIAHELCHLFEFNHGPRFYRRLAQVMPDWRQRESLLKQF